MSRKVMRIIVLLCALLFSFSSFGLEPKLNLSPANLYGQSDVVAIIRLKSGSYEQGLGDGYELTGEVIDILKGNPPKELSYRDGDDYAEPCFSRKLGAYYIVFLKDKHTLWARGASFELSGVSNQAMKNSKINVAEFMQKEYATTAYVGKKYTWYRESCMCEARFGDEYYGKYQELISSVLEYTFNK